jgi:hypothetical protein
MSAAVMMKRIAKASPRFKARLAGVFFLLIMLTAAFTQLVVRGRLSLAGDIAKGIVEVSSMVAVTLLLYVVFKPVNQALSLLAAFVNLAGLTFEAFQWQPRGVGVGMVLHGFYWLLIGYLMFRSTFLPRILAALMTIAGLGWLTYLSPALANYLSPYNLASALLAEGLVFLWLLAMGVDIPKRKRKQELGKLMERGQPLLPVIGRSLNVSLRSRR